MTRPGPRARGYDRQWESRRANHLALHPWCVACAEEGNRIRATVADHIKPHRGDRRAFAGPLQSLCAHHHSRHKQQQETRGYHGGVDANGLPTDPKHPFNQGQAPS